MNVSIVKARNYEQSEVRRAMLKAFQLLDMDIDNPFEKFIFPGDRVFIKPNWVAHKYRNSCPQSYDIFSTITHPSLIKETARFVDIALKGSGLVTIGDNPSIDADFNGLMKVQGLHDLEDELQTECRILDLRPLVCKDLKHYGNKDKMVPQTGDPEGETVLNLGKESLLYGMNPKRFRGVFDQREETVNAHSGETHLYGFSNAIFKSDVFISIPKLKTHHKVGTTLNLKGLVGTIGSKNYLVHWREGFPLIGGDAYPDFWSWLKDRFRRVKKRGAWQGNDTIWRMVVDLYRGIQQGPKRYFSIIDGIVGGQANGPFCPEPIHSQTLIAGANLLAVDLVASRLMGFNINNIRYLNYFLTSGSVSTDGIRVVSDYISNETFFDQKNRHLSFKPPDRWNDL